MSRRKNDYRDANKVTVTVTHKSGRVTTLRRRDDDLEPPSQRRFKPNLNTLSVLNDDTFEMEKVPTSARLERAVRHARQLKKLGKTVILSTQVRDAAGNYQTVTVPLGKVDYLDLRSDSNGVNSQPVEFPEDFAASLPTRRFGRTRASTGIVPSRAR